jgi:cell division septation protein DedD
MIQEHGLKFAKVVSHPSEAKALGLKIDKTDEAAYKTEQSFALLLHGAQPKGSKASESLKKLRAEGIEYAY